MCLMLKANVFGARDELTHLAIKVNTFGTGAVWIITVGNRLFTEPERLVTDRYCCARTS